MHCTLHILTREATACIAHSTSLQVRLQHTTQPVAACTLCSFKMTNLPASLPWCNAFKTVVVVLLACLVCCICTLLAWLCNICTAALLLTHEGSPAPTMSAPLLTRPDCRHAHCNDINQGSVCCSWDTGLVFCDRLIHAASYTVHAVLFSSGAFHVPSHVFRLGHKIIHCMKDAHGLGICK